MRPKEHHYRESICARTKRESKLQSVYRCHPVPTVFQPGTQGLSAFIPRHLRRAAPHPAESKCVHRTLTVLKTAMFSSPASVCVEPSAWAMGRTYPTRCANTTLNQEKISSFLHADIREGSFALCCIVRTTTCQDEAQASPGAACHLAPFPLMYLLSWRPQGQDTTTSVFVQHLTWGTPGSPRAPLSVAIVQRQQLRKMCTYDLNDSRK